MGILSSLFGNKQQLWKEYQRNPMYINYGGTPMPNAQNMTSSFCKINAQNFLKQFNESIKIIGSTKKPDIFFSRYDFAIKRGIALIYTRKYVRMTGDNIEKNTNQLIEHKQEFTRQMIDRVYIDYNEKINKLKTLKAKAKKIDEFENCFKPFLNEMCPENISYIQELTNRLKNLLSP